jgi:hypothetical protein
VLLLEVLPPDGEVVDAARRLREHVLGCKGGGHVTIAGLGGLPVNCEVRVRRFRSGSSSFGSPGGVVRRVDCGWEHPCLQTKDGPPGPASGE